MLRRLKVWDLEVDMAGVGVAARNTRVAAGPKKTLPVERKGLFGVVEDRARQSAAVLTSAVGRMFGLASFRKPKGLDLAPMRNPQTPHERRCRQALSVFSGGLLGWPSMKFGVSTTLQRTFNAASKGKPGAVAYTVSGGVGWIGRAGTDPRNPLECAGSKPSTRAMLIAYMARTNSGKRHISNLLGDPDAVSLSPATLAARCARLADVQVDAFLRKHYIFSERMTPRTPALFRADPLKVRADRISPTLSYPVLEKSFGVGFDDFWASQYETGRRRAKEPKVNWVDFAAHSAASTARPLSHPDTSEVFGGKGNAAARNTILVVVRSPTGETARAMLRSSTSVAEAAAVGSLHDLVAGKYPVLSAPEVDPATPDVGWLVVASDRSLTYYDRFMREHNAYGPSRVAPDGSAAGHAFGGIEYGDAAALRRRVEANERIERERLAVRAARLQSSGGRFGFAPSPDPSATKTLERAVA